MIDQRSAYQINVCEVYFDVDDMPMIKYESVLDASAMIYMNTTISKKEAVRFIGEKISTEKPELTTFRVSYETLSIDRIKDFKDNVIFANKNERYRGWLLQYDPTPFANWYHDCFYYFVIDFDFYQEIKYNRGLSAAIKMQEISVEECGEFTNEKMCNFTFRWH